MVFYFLFAGQLSTTEVVAGLPAATVAAAFAVLMHRARSRDLDLHAPWLRVVVGPLAALIPDAIRVGAVLLSALWRRPLGPVGVITKQPFRHGDDSVGDAGRRGLVILSASLAPNGYVLYLPSNQDALITHRLVATTPRPDREWPV